MNILSIETSCDETAVSIVEATGGIDAPSFAVLGNALYSQIAIHAEYGGVFPMLAKREHTINLSPLLLQALKQATLYTEKETSHPHYSPETWSIIEKILEKERGLCTPFKASLEHVVAPAIDCIAVTNGPGLEPALWVGISFAKALGVLWNKPVLPTNHMAGHIASVLVGESPTRIAFPALALLISGGHTELVSASGWGAYTVLGQTRDDAVGEAFDKAARMLGLPYPGGPEISRLAGLARASNLPHTVTLPRPMIHSGDLDFSFSGLKTAVLYYLRDHTETLSEEERQSIAREFEDAVIDVLVKKTGDALDAGHTESSVPGEVSNFKTLIIAGGVIANKKIRETFMSLKNSYSDLTVFVPTLHLATDNAIMIAAAAYIETLVHPEALTQAIPFRANGNLQL